MKDYLSYDKILDKTIIRDNHIPTPPTPDGVWRNKRDDHGYFQKNSF
jgi:hypothetical protein